MSVCFSFYENWIFIFIFMFSFRCSCCVVILVVYVWIVRCVWIVRWVLNLSQFNWHFSLTKVLYDANVLKQKLSRLNEWVAFVLSVFEGKQQHPSLCFYTWNNFHVFMPCFLFVVPHWVSFDKVWETGQMKI